MRALNDRPHILIASLIGSWTGLVRLPATLRRAGARVTAFVPPRAMITRSRFVDYHIACSTDPANYALELKHHLQQAPGYDWIIHGDEPSLMAVAQHQLGDWPADAFPVSTEDRAFERVISKAALARLANEYDIPVPATRICHELDEVLDATRQLHWPIVMKSAVGWAGDAVRVIERADDVPGAFNALRGHDNQPVIVQEFISGDVGLTPILFDHGVPIFWYSQIKALFHPTPTSPSTIRTFIDIPEMETILTRLGQMTAFHGFCSVDWIRTRDGQVKVLELNPRPTPGFNLGHRVRADASRALAAMLRGERDIQRPGRADPMNRVHLFPQYFRRCIDRGEWRNLAGAIFSNIWRDVPWNDPRLAAMGARDLAAACIASLRSWRHARKTDPIVLPRASKT